MRVAWCVVVLCASSAGAQPEETPEEVIEIDDLRLLRPPTYEPASVTIVDGAELARIPAMLADDALRAVPSVAMFRRSSSWVADPTSQGVNLRGLGPSGVSRALVLRDGVPLNDPFGGWVYWRAIPLRSIERVEIQPSGASSIFGNFGLGGAIGLTSQPITERTVEAVVGLGSRDTVRGSLRGSERLGPVGVEIDGEAVDSGGFAPIASHHRGAVDGLAASEHRVAGARAEYVRNASTFRGFARYFDQELDAGTQFTTAAVRTVTYGAGWTYARADQRVDVTAFGGAQRFEQTRARVNEDRSSAELASAQSTPSTSYGASALWTTRALGSHVVQLGVDASRVSGTATDQLSPVMTTDMTVVERSAGGEQRFAGAFVQDSARLHERLELSASLRVDGWQNRDGSREITRGSGATEVTPFDDRSELQLSPRVGLLAHLSDQLAVRGSVYRAFRAPTLNELYRPFQVGTVLTAANDALRPETLWGGELGPQVAVETVLVRAVGFYNHMSDPIFNATLPMPENGAARMRQNLGAARVMGVELEATWRPSPAWSAVAAHTFMIANVTDAPAQPELVGMRLAQVPQHRTSLSLAFDDPRFLTAALDVRYTSPQFEDDRNTLAMGSFVVVDALVRRKITGGLSAFAMVQNLFDSEYLVGRAGVDTVGQPRTVMTGIELLWQPTRSARILDE